MAKLRRPTVQDIPNPSFFSEVCGIMLMLPIVLLLALCFSSCASTEYQPPVRLREDPAAAIERQHYLETNVEGYLYATHKIR